MASIEIRTARPAQDGREGAEHDDTEGEKPGNDERFARDGMEGSEHGDAERSTRSVAEGTGKLSKGVPLHSPFYDNQTS